MVSDWLMRHPRAGAHPHHIRMTYKKKKIGAGEGIRTLDPDLGKVVLYP
jgi:hypothetical protein